MDVKIVYSEDSQIDLHKAVCFYELSGKKDLFLDDFFYLLDLIQGMPEMFQIKYRKIRIAKMESFPYSIHYSFYGKVVYIYRIYPDRMEYV